jgi:hypothetical protein
MLIDVVVLRKNIIPTSRRHFFQPVFMVQPAENILDSDPAGGWQLMPLNCLSLYWLPMEIWNARPQARVWPSLIVVGDPVPQDCSKMLLTQRDHVVQVLTADASYQPFTVGIGQSRQLHRVATMSTLAFT